MAKKESSDEECSNSGSKDEEYAMAAFQRSRDDKNGKGDRKCFRCGDPNHLIGECPKPPKDKKPKSFCRKALGAIAGEKMMKRSKMKRVCISRIKREHQSDTQVLTVKMEILLEPSSNKLMVGDLKVKESLNVTFDETPPPSKTSPLVDDDLDEEEAIKVTEKKNLENDIEDETLEIDEIVNIKESRNHPLENVIETLTKEPLDHKPKPSNSFCFISTYNLKKCECTLTDDSWIVAMQEELNQFIANDLVAQGYNQQEGIDYDETYALVARLESIRILLAYACALDFKLFQMDVKSAMPLDSSPSSILYRDNLNTSSEFFSYTLEEFAQILDIPCVGACVFTNKWSLDELAYDVPRDGPYQTNPPSPDDIISCIQNDREVEISSWRGARVDVRTYLLGGAINGSKANGIIRDPKLELESSRFTFDLVPLSYESVDVVVGENWLLRHKAEMVFHGRNCKVRVGSNGNLLWKAFVLLGGVRVARKDDCEVTKGREDVREVFQQRGSGAKRKLSRCGRNQMGNEPILALPDRADDFVVYYDARSKDLEACLEKGRRLTNRWLSMKKDIASCGSKYLTYSEEEVEYQGSSRLLLQPELWVVEGLTSERCSMFGKKDKLEPSYVGPFEILGWIGPIVRQFLFDELRVGCFFSFRVVVLLIALARWESPKTPTFHDYPLNESPNEDSTSQRSSSNVRQIHTPFEHLGRWTKDHPIANMIGDPSRSVSIRNQLETDAMWCYFDAFLTLVEPKNFKQAMTEPSWIDAMQEEIHKFERLEVWELVPCPYNVFLIKIK
ncbi:retrovirus-related pol polyprotein from transposon TNT 1-94 [Tanacetum coccineum]|uniref:Retrovirus-related pol polyprotein from transposon TNT 1-94 n=1 Tax=Tanacetum coccineum TaxID=301880 RepID=A0ABQ4XNC5_9ASTR